MIDLKLIKIESSLLLSKESSTSTVCRKEGSSDESDSDYEKQQSDKDCSESFVDSGSVLASFLLSFIMLHMLNVLCTMPFAMTFSKGVVHYYSMPHYYIYATSL